MDKKVALYTFFDDVYFEYGFTMLYSFITNNPWFKGDILILCDNGENSSLSEENLEKIKRLYNRTSLHKVDISVYTPVFDNFPGSNRKFIKACLYKLELFKKDDYDVKLYIDADGCFHKSVEDLFFHDQLENALGFMCRDVVSSNYFSNEITPKTDDDYANMGFFVVNGRMLKDTDFEELINSCQTVKNETFKNKHSFRGAYPDQDCLNEFANNILMLPALIYNAPAHRVSFDNIKNVKIFHYYGLKPWDSGQNYVSYYVWYKYNFFAMRRLKEITKELV